MNRNYLIKFLFLLLPTTSFCQDKAITCTDLKNGIFYNYPKNTSDQYIDRRDGDIVYEASLITGDTSLWQVKWTSDCVYALKYKEGSFKWDAKTLDFLKHHTLVFEIVNTAAQYYVFKFYVDKVSDISVKSDTMWLNQKLVASSNDVYRQVANNAILKKNHFSDTSKYAVVYLYRPGKLTNGLANYPVYLNNDIICMAQNNSGYIFKIFKEGPFEFKSKLYKDESSVTLSVKFGNTYYVKSMIHWTISSRLYNFKLENVIVDAEKGQTEFQAVNLR